MIARIACIVIATERRRDQVWSHVVPSIEGQGFQFLRVVGDWEETLDYRGRYLCVAPLTRTTTDALVKRDIGTLSVPRADVLVYLNDDHTLAPGFGAALRAVLDEPWSVIVPNRYILHPVFPSHPLAASNEDLSPQRVALPNGEPTDAPQVINYPGAERGYCAGHAGIFRRDVITRKPWSAYAHHRSWDVIISQEQQAYGARFVWSPRAGLDIFDIEPQNSPWR